MTVTVLIADDQTVVREGLRSMLALIEGIEVLGVAASAEEAIAAVESLDPDVLLTDLRMPGIGGVEGIRRLAAADARTRCVALTTYDDDATIRDAVGAGALGFLNKDADPDTIASAIRAAAGGRSLLDTRVTAALLAAPATTEPDDDAAYSADGLTEREVEVLRLIARGLSNAQITRELYVSMSTVKTHINHLLAKTGCAGRAALVTYAYERGVAG
ncbi:response regulator [Rudaeicoccus suwonensis]|uniref:LuxR family two component transcriptional regulator n=1 Tax=Rudaeicoccus suwonensis TaxID=657409 RepID=A0A561E6S3_9MICO|nr:response regulator transcription factor [Rudaeicoccus suwonensis]TWE11316.1 LuxR family two component transcriptional regulator [Rudaeicoccus suwonensis]